MFTEVPSAVLGWCDRLMSPGITVVVSALPGSSLVSAWAGYLQPSQCFDNKTEYNREDGVTLVLLLPTMKEYLLKNSRVQIYTI